jgi:amino acid transporter
MTGFLETQGGADKMGGKQVVHDVEDPPPESVPTFRAISPDDGQIVTQQERQSLIRGLSQRHVQMIAIAGAIVRSPLGADLGFEFADIRGGDV